MAKAYPTEARELCRQLYCKYGGQNHASIEKEMRRQYPGWRRENLYDKGKGAKAQLGWINRYGFDRSLELYTQKLTEKVNDDEQDLYIGIKQIRKKMHVRAQAEDATKDEIYQYRDFCKLEIEARRNLDLSRDNLETFVAAYEKVLTWLSEIDEEAARLLLKHGERLTELAKAHYGTKEADDNGTGTGPDESGK